ncbi:MAG TPA: GatB/YqeY domain-containing protein [Vicinamibacterales bacterium]|nr:GatB/YqeY domain-containing protein [Vicinamibacterales bacterium]
MPLIDEISAAMTAAMKAKDPARLAPLRMAKAALMNREVEKGRPLDETEAQQVVASLIKQRRDSIEQFLKGGREELAARETAEIAVLETYLPPPVDPAEIERAVDESIREVGATSAKDLGRVMKAVMSRIAGKGADGRTVNEIVRRKLGA